MNINELVKQLQKDRDVQLVKQFTDEVADVYEFDYSSNLKFDNAKGEINEEINQERFEEIQKLVYCNRTLKEHYSSLKSNFDETFPILLKFDYFHYIENTEYEELILDHYLNPASVSTKYLLCTPFANSSKLLLRISQAVMNKFPISYEYLIIYKHILFHHLTTENEKLILLDQLCDEFRNTDNDIIKMNIADVFTLFLSHSFVGLQMLNELREVDEVDGERSFYEDNQNVHDVGVHLSILRAANELIHLSKNKDINIVYDESINRIRLDSTVFEYNQVIKEENEQRGGEVVLSTRFTLLDVFRGLYFFIENHENAEELRKRLKEELNEMGNYCSTGYLARLVNVVQGFVENENLIIKITNEQEIFAKLKTRVGRRLTNEDILNSMIGETIEERTPFLNIVEEVLNEILLENDFEIKDVLKSLYKYTQIHWKFRNNEFYFKEKPGFEKELDEIRIY